MTFTEAPLSTGNFTSFLVYKLFSVDYFWVIILLRDGLYRFRLCKNACNVLHIAVSGGFIPQAVQFSSLSCAGCFEIMSAPASCTFWIPRWTLVFFERMCFVCLVLGFATQLFLDLSSWRRNG